MITIPSIEETPEFLEAQRAQEALEKRQEQIQNAKDAHDALVAQRGALSESLDTLRARRVRGLLEVTTIERLAAAKSDQLAADFGKEGNQAGVMPKLAAQVVELNGTVTHLRKKVLVALDAEIAAAEKALREFDAENPL
ncbi:MAG: hypothetical protein U1G08_18875 [Verrucomicrobiota bacterium]